VDGSPYELLSLADLGLAPPQETGSTFLANALLKAEHAAYSSGEAALADDSGLEVDALGGAPGIYSARYAGGVQLSSKDADAANNAKLLRELAGIAFAQRSARYRCALVLIDARLAAPVVAEEYWDGFILEEPRGANGFGYDPHFWLPDQRLTAAQLAPEEKNRLSHRGRALGALRTALTLPAGQPQ
jgi:XTP/dITP diphosphohydrolase